MESLQVGSNGSIRSYLCTVKKKDFFRVVYLCVEHRLGIYKPKYITTVCASSISDCDCSGGGGPVSGKTTSNLDVACPKRARAQPCQLINQYKSYGLEISDQTKKERERGTDQSFTSMSPHSKSVAIVQIQPTAERPRGLDKGEIRSRRGRAARSKRTRKPMTTKKAPVRSRGTVYARLGGVAAWMAVA
jgi:hypothetical protein